MFGRRVARRRTGVRQHLTSGDRRHGTRAFGRWTARRGAGYAGGHTARRPARTRAGKAVPAAVIAAALAAGAAAYGISSAGGSPAASLSASLGNAPRAATAAAGHASASPGAFTDGMAGAAPILARGPAAVPHQAAKPARRPAGRPPTQARTTALTPAGPARGASVSQQQAPVQGGSATRPTAAPVKTTASCGVSAGLQPENAGAIVSFLLAHGYSGNAAAGIAGNIYQESKGNPESAGDGGGGLIGWTPLPAGLVTGNPAADLQAQLAGILTFNQQWSSFLPALNGAATPAAAADIYVTDFERAGIPAAGTREAAATDVAAACGL
jgi:hypothetical protein